MPYIPSEIGSLNNSASARIFRGTPGSRPNLPSFLPVDQLIVKVVRFLSQFSNGRCLRLRVNVLRISEWLQLIAKMVHFEHPKNFHVIYGVNHWLALSTNVLTWIYGNRMFRTEIYFAWRGNGFEIECSAFISFLLGRNPEML